MTRREIVVQVEEKIVNLEHAKPLSGTWGLCLVLVTAL